MEVDAKTGAAVLTIKNKHGDFRVLIDIEDWPRASRHSWHAKRVKDRVYFVTTINRHKVRLHRFITGATAPDVQVDHKDHDYCDNRKQSLRPCTVAQNVQNRRNLRVTQGRFKGVFRSPAEGRWSARITYEGKHIHLGSFGSREEAARTYDAAALKYHGEFACTNFPRSDYDVV